MFIIIIILCSILPPISIFNLTNFKTLISYSSINQSRWILFLINLKIIIWFKYFIFYRLTLLSFIYIIYLFKINYNSNNIYNNKNFNVIFLFYIFNLAGLPPFSFFYIKWYSIHLFIINRNIIPIIIILMFRSLIILFIYTNILTTSFFLFKIKSKILNLQPTYKNYFRLIIYICLIISLIIFII